MLPRRRALALIALGPLPLPRVAVAARSHVGHVTALAGSAAALFSGEAPRALAPGAPVMVEDLLTTGPAARLSCQLGIGTTLQLGENASLRIDAVALRGSRTGTALRSFGGAVLLDLPPASSSARAVPTSLTLPWAYIGVRGTRFFAGRLNERNAVFVGRGEVQVSAGGAHAVMSAGEGVDVSEDGRLGPVTRWGDARIRAALALVS